MRISDWSSDVCSSDLNAGHYTGRGQNDFAAFRDRDFFDRRDFDDGHMLSSMIALGNSQLRRCRPYAALRFGIEFAACSSRSEEHTSELQSLMRISYAVFCLKKKKSTPTSKLYMLIHIYPRPNPTQH